MKNSEEPNHHFEIGLLVLGSLLACLLALIIFL